MNRIYVLIMTTVLLASCKETENDTSIPNCDVYIKTDYAEYTKLSVVNNHVTYVRSANASMPSNFRLGYGGIVIYRTLEGKAVAFDLACPVEVSREVLVNVESIYATCPICGSKFDLSYGIGAPCEGPAKETLRHYNCIDDGSQIRVSN